MNLSYSHMLILRKMEFIRTGSHTGILWLVYVYFASVISYTEGTVQEVCYFESFTASCEHNEVVMMKTAMYGQMRPARCYEDTGDYSCTSDVLAQADAMCSGRTQCSISVPNEQFESSKSCIRSIKGYFEGDYTCEKVSTIGNLCQSNAAIPLTSTPITISRAADGQSCSVNNLEIQANPGQQINVTMVDFRWGSASRTCVPYGDVVDKQTGRRVTLCGGQHRVTNLLMSVSSAVKLNLNPVSSDMGYLLMFTAVGCEDLTPPHGGWMNRSHSHVTMGCSNSHQQWQLRCIGSKWVGQMEKCMEVIIQEDNAVVVRRGMPLPNDIIIAIIVAIAILLAVLIITLGVIFYKRSERKRNLLMQQQQQKLIFHTLKMRSKDGQEDYMSPMFVHQDRSQGHRPDSTYESIHVFNRTLPSAPNGSTLPVSNTLLSGGTGANTLPVIAVARQADEDPYNAS